MKNIFSFAILILFILGLTSIFVHATADTSCQTDVDQMTAQINQYTSITSPVDGTQLIEVISPVQTSVSQCSAIGYMADDTPCTVGWEKGNWGDTFRCE